MIRVGIHEDLVLSKAQRNDKGTLGLAFRPKSLDGPKKKKSFFEASKGLEAQADESDSMLLLFPFKVPTFKGKDGNDLTDDEKVEIITREIGTFQAQLSQILGAYRSVKDVDLDPWVGTGVTEENFEKEILDNDTLKKAYDNYVDGFIEYVTPFLDDDSRPVRLKLVRQSKAKHYATIPSRYIQDNPFIEPMEVPKASSKLAYTKYEKENGFDSGDPVSQEAADPVPDSPAPTSSGTGSVFGAR